MNLQQLAESDLSLTLEADGQTVTLTDPSGLSAALPAMSNDIGMLIDPDTGAPVSGRSVGVVLRISTLTAAGFGLPRGVDEYDGTPWLIEYTTVDGVSLRGRVQSSMPDRSLGVVSLRMELIA